MSNNQTRDEAQAIKALIERPVQLTDSIAAEQGLLRALAQDTHGEHQAFALTIAGGVQDRDFTPTSAWHRQLWVAIKALQQRGVPCNHATLLRELRKTQPADSRIDYDALLSELYAVEADWSSLDAYIEEVREAGIQRYVQIESLTLLHGARRMDAAMLSSRLAALSERTVSNKSISTSLDEGLDELRTHWYERYDDVIHDRGAALRTPLQGINDAFVDFEPGMFLLLGGAPKAGKTKLATWMAWHFIHDCGAVVDWFSTEMSRKATFCSLMGPSHGLTLRQALHLKPTEDDMRACRGDRHAAAAMVAKAATDAARDYRTLQGTIHHTMVGGDVSVRTIEATIKRRRIEMSAREDKRPYIAIVDYLQGVPSGDNLGSERDEIRQVSLLLNAVTNQLNVPMLALYHTNRNSPLQAYGSAQMEKDADSSNVIQAVEGQPDDYRELVGTWNRHAQSKVVRLRANLAHARFEMWPEDTTHRRAR